MRKKTSSWEEAQKNVNMHEFYSGILLKYNIYISYG